MANIRLLDRNTEVEDLVNVARYIEKSKRYTAWYDANKNGKVDYPGDYSSINHILLSPELAGRVINTYIQQDYSPLEVSDHFPIIVRLKLSSILLPVITDEKILPPPVVVRVKPDLMPAPNPSAPTAPTTPNSKPPTDRKYLPGSRGGCYYLTKSGSKKYVDRSFCD